MSYSSCGYSSNGCSSGGCGYSGSSGLEECVKYQPSSGSDYNSNTSYFIADVETPKSRPIFIDAKVKPFSQYGLINQDQKYDWRSSKPRYYVGVDVFLKPDRDLTPFIGEVSEIKDFILEAFEKTTGMQFPDDIEVHLLDVDGMKKVHEFNKNIHGFAINRKTQGLISSVFVRKDELAKVMLTLGHEIGHALTVHLGDKILEEAKAFAFQMKWMQVIKGDDIANLGTQIELDKPAVNGIHNVAFDFVLKHVREGRNVFDVYLDIINRRLKIGG